MGVSPNTYIMIGVQPGDDWGHLPTDSGDDWYDRHADLIIYAPKQGDFVLTSNIDGKDYFLGRVIDFCRGQWDVPTFRESFDVDRVQREVEEVSVILQKRWGITERPKLWIITVHT